MNRGSITKLHNRFVAHPLFAYLENIVYQPRYARFSYSQEGEDMILRRMFEGKKEGFYVDVGAHHPKRFSNTFYFYQKGWRGINIDAMPGSMRSFEQLRPHDINLEFAISDRQETLVYYMFTEPALNTLSVEDATYVEKNGRNKIVAQTPIETRTLASVLDQYLAPNCKISFLSIDVEGLDLNVAKSNAWDTYRPEIVLLEERCDKKNMLDILEGDLYKFMTSVHYQFIAKTYNTLFFKLAP